MKYNHLKDNKPLQDIIAKSSSILRQRPQLIRSQVYDFVYDIDCTIADINQQTYELSESFSILEEFRKQIEGNLWEASSENSTSKFYYELEEDDDWRAISSEIQTIKEARDLLNSIKWDLMKKRESILKVFDKEP